MRVKMKTTRVVITGLMLALLACLGHAGAVARAPEMQSTTSSGEAPTSRPTMPGIERRADRLLREMSAYLSAFSWRIDLCLDKS